LVSEGQPTVDPKLASLGVDGLLTHIETVRDLRDAATLLEEVDVAARFRRVSHGFSVLPLMPGNRIQPAISTELGTHQRAWSSTTAGVPRRRGPAALRRGVSIQPTPP